MPTLFIHVPYSKVEESKKKSFTQTVATGRGDGFAISRGQFQQLKPGDPIVVICRTHKKKAAGQIRELIPTEKAGNGLQRYDIVIAGLEPVPYTHEDVIFHRTGVAVL